MNYLKLIEKKPTALGWMVNSINQTIVFFEDPDFGDEASVICVCHELQIAEYSGFYETTDMLADHKEYEPKFVDGKLIIGEN